MNFDVRCVNKKMVEPRRVYRSRVTYTIYIVLVLLKSKNHVVGGLNEILRMQHV